MLGHKDVARRIDGKPLGVAYARRVTLSGRKSLIGFVGIVAPDAPASLKLGARLRARRTRLAVLQLARVAGAGDVDVHGSGSIDDEGMHGMVAAERQSGNHGYRTTLGHNFPRIQCVTNYAIVAFRVEPAFVEADASTAFSSGLGGFTKAFDNISFSGSGSIPQCDQKSTLMRRLIVVVSAGPGVDIHHSIGRDYQLTSMADLVGKHGRAETGSEFQVAVVIRADLRIGSGSASDRSCKGEDNESHKQSIHQGS